jgi:hypothetical protein
VNDEEFTNPWASSPVYDDHEGFDEWIASGQPLLNLQNASSSASEEDEFINPFAEKTYMKEAVFGLESTNHGKQKSS